MTQNLYYSVEALDYFSFSPGKPMWQFAAPYALDFNVKTNKAVSLRAHRDSTRRRVQPLACEECGTLAAD